MSATRGSGPPRTAVDGEPVGPLPEPPKRPAWYRRLPVSGWPRSTQVAAGVAAALGVVALISLAALGSWTNNAERGRLHAIDLASDHDAKVQRLEAQVEGLAEELESAGQTISRARAAAARAQEEAREAAEQELEERVAEAEAELEEARQEIAETRAALDEREAQLTQAEERQARSTFGDGIHVVGEDIEPGTYRTEGSGSCYWARLSGLSGEFSDIIANDNPRGPLTVQIQASDAAFESSRCGQWTRR